MPHHHPSHLWPQRGRGMSRNKADEQRSRDETLRGPKERLAHTKQEWWPRVLTAFQFLVPLSPEAHFQLLPVGAERPLASPPIAFQ